MRSNKLKINKSCEKELQQLMLQFVSHLPMRLLEIDAAVEAGHLEKVAQLAHRLCGAAGSYGISNLAKESKNLECVAHLKDMASSRKSLLSIQNIAKSLH